MFSLLYKTVKLFGTFARFELMADLVLLDQELGGELTELSELEKSGSVLIDLLDDLLQSHRLDLKIVTKRA